METLKRKIDSDKLLGVIDLPKSMMSRSVEITVRTLDDTDYLLANEANKDHLLSSIADFERKRDLTTVDAERLEDALKAKKA